MTSVSSCVYKGVVALLIFLGITMLIQINATAEASGDGLHKQREVWVAIREDGKAGTGTAADPFDGGMVEKLNGLFDKFRNEYGDNLTIHFGPGVFYGDRLQEPRNHWKIRGAGMDITVFKTASNPNSIRTFGIHIETGYGPGIDGVEVSDITFDFNILNLRRPNRAFVWPRDKRFEVSYVYVDSPAEWSEKTQYQRGQTVQFQKAEFIALKESQGQSPVQGEFWSALRSNRPGDSPSWDATKAYSLGEAVTKENRVNLCIEACKGADPAGSAANWQAVNPDAPDPDVGTGAVRVSNRPPGGWHRVTRVKIINGNGSAFFDHEGFLISLGGNNNVIEDCIVEKFHGDYASLLVICFGRHGVIRGCTVLGNDGLSTMAYGGWAVWDAVFENNFCSNVRSATNIDTMNCRNVTFRNNVFVNCREVGILVNAGGVPVEQYRKYSMVIEGKTIADTDFARACMDGLYMYNNLVEMRDGAPYGAIQICLPGVTNAVIHDNVLRTMSGHGGGLAIGVYKSGAPAIVYNNVCEPDMYCEMIPAPAVWKNNVDFSGQPMKVSQGQPIQSRKESKETRESKP